MSDPRPTKKQRQILTFLTQFLDQHGYSPSYREIGAMVGIKSVSTVSKHVDNLVAKGFVEKENYGARSLSIVGRSDRFVPIGQSGESFEKQFVDQVEARLKELEQQSNVEQGEILQIETLIEAMKLLGLQSATVGLKRRIDSLGTKNKNDSKKTLDTSNEKARKAEEVEILP